MVSTISIRKRSAFQRRMRRIIHEFLTEYETPKIVSIHSISYAVLLRIIQIIILIYSVVYLLIYERGYQKIDTSIISAVTLKVKGVGFILRANKERVVMDVAGKISSIHCSMMKLAVGIQITSFQLRKIMRSLS